MRTGIGIPCFFVFRFIAFCRNHIVHKLKVRPSTRAKIITHWRLRWWSTLFSSKIFLIKLCIPFFCRGFFWAGGHNAIAHLIFYSVMWLTYGLGNQKIRVDAGTCCSLCPTCGFLLVIETLSQMSLPLRSLTRLHTSKVVSPWCTHENHYRIALVY